MQRHAGDLLKNGCRLSRGLRNHTPLRDDDRESDRSVMGMFIKVKRFV